MPPFGTNHPPPGPYPGPMQGFGPPPYPQQKQGGFGHLINKMLGSTQNHKTFQGPPGATGNAGVPYPPDFPGGPGVPGFENKEKWLGLVSNVQKGLTFVETVGPLIQQYGPIVKNLPSMLAMFKEMQKSENDIQTDENTPTIIEENHDTNRDKNHSPSSSDQNQDQKKKETSHSFPAAKKAPERKKESVPKLYI